VAGFVNPNAARRDDPVVRRRLASTRSPESAAFRQDGAGRNRVEGALDGITRF